MKTALTVILLLLIPGLPCSAEELSIYETATLDFVGGNPTGNFLVATNSLGEEVDYYIWRLDKSEGCVVTVDKSGVSGFFAVLWDQKHGEFKRGEVEGGIWSNEQADKRLDRILKQKFMFLTGRALLKLFSLPDK